MKKLILLVLLTAFICEAHVAPKPIIEDSPVLTWTIKSLKVESLDFNQAYQQIVVYEGGYANNPSDPGGETYCGISRKSHPNWSGWEFIDRNKPIKWNTKFSELNSSVWSFYRNTYWSSKRLKLNEFGNQKLAEEMFDISVNMGMYTSLDLLKNSMNVLNNRDYTMVQTSSIEEMLPIIQYNSKDSIYINSLVKVLNGMQLKRYIEICEKNPSRKKFLKVWLRRI